METLKQITGLKVDEFVNMLFNREANGKNSATFSLIETVTFPDLNKKSRVDGSACPFVTVAKMSRSYCSFNVIYENAVNNKELKTGETIRDEDHNPGEYEAHPLPWGAWKVNPMTGKNSKIIISHKGKDYIRATFNTQIKPETVYSGLTPSGEWKTITKEEIKDFLKKDSDDFVTVRTFKAESVKRVHLDGVIFEMSLNMEGDG